MDGDTPAELEYPTLALTGHVALRSLNDSEGSGVRRDTTMLLSNEQMRLFTAVMLEVMATAAKLQRRHKPPASVARPSPLAELWRVGTVKFRTLSATAGEAEGLS